VEHNPQLVRILFSSAVFNCFLSFSSGRNGHWFLREASHTRQAILACRCLTNMLDALPNSSGAVATCIPSLCSKVVWLSRSTHLALAAARARACLQF
jgi:hypothetical protein